MRAVDDIIDDILACCDDRNGAAECRVDALRYCQELIAAVRSQWSSALNGQEPRRDRTPENVTCPECGGPMVSRRSSHGVFWGCRAYPACRGTRDVEGRSASEREYAREWGAGR